MLFSSFPTILQRKRRSFKFTKVNTHLKRLFAANAASSADISAHFGLNVLGKHFLRAFIRPGQLVQDWEIMREILVHNSVMNGMVAAGSEAKGAESRLPGVPNFTVDEKKPAAVRGSKGSPGAGVDPEADA
jgi:hypothetical protein